MKVKIIASIGNFYRLKVVDVDVKNLLAELQREIPAFAEEFMQYEEAKKFALDEPLKIKVL